MAERIAPVGKTTAVLSAPKAAVGVGAACGLYYMTMRRREETPVLSRDGAETDLTSAADAAEAEADPLNDAALMGDLFARMQKLAEEPEAAPEEADPPAEPLDSTDGWGVGSTAVLEPPKPGSDEPGSGPRADDELPLGFPLRGNEPPLDFEVDTQPAADEESIAMLERMFGTRAD